MTPMHRNVLALALCTALGAGNAAAADDAVPTGPLPRTVVPSEVRLELKLDPKQANFSGTTSISVDVAEPTNVIWMHGQGLKISKADAAFAKVWQLSDTVDRSALVEGMVLPPWPADDDWEHDWRYTFGDRWPEVKEQWQLDIRDTAVSAPKGDLERLLNW